MNRAENLSAVETLLSRGFKPADLGIKSNDPVLERCAAISDVFVDLGLTRYGVDYFFGRNQGHPHSSKENVSRAIYHQRQGVELWRPIKSVALTTLNDPLIAVHLRADRQINTPALCGVLGVREKAMTKAALGGFDVDYGTVNPFMKAPVPIRHVFDRDLVEGEDYPGDNLVFTSSGDVNLYVGFNIKRYLEAVYQTEVSEATFSISEPEPGTNRIIARRPVVIFGGDSAVDTFNFSKAVAEAIMKVLVEKGVYFGDRSLPEIYSISDPRLAGSIDTNLYGEVIRANVAQVTARSTKFVGRERLLLGTFSSFALHGAADEQLHQTEGIEYVGLKEAVEDVLAKLDNQQLEIAHTLLLGLPSMHTSGTSAFSGKILDDALPVHDSAMGQMLDFVQKRKTGEANSMRFYQIIVNILRKATHNVEGLKGKNVVVILGASELENFVEEFVSEETTGHFTVIRTDDPASITEKIQKAAGSKIHLIFIQPTKALAKIIAQKTLV